MGGAVRQDLPLPTACTIDGEAFAFESVCEQKGCGHLGLRCRGRKIDSFETPQPL